MTNLQSLDLLQRDGFLVPAKLLKEILFITILLVIQQVHQPKELPHVVLHRSTCKNIGGTVADCAHLVVCAICVCIIQHVGKLQSSLQCQNAQMVDPYPRHAQQCTKYSFALPVQMVSEHV